MSEGSGKELFRRYMAVWETGELDKLGPILHAGYVGHPSHGDRDQEGLRQRIVAFRQAYPDVRFRIEDQLTEGDRVASRLVATATRMSDGRAVILYGLNISRIADDRIIEEWMAWEVQPARPALMEIPHAAWNGG